MPWAVQRTSGAELTDNASCMDKAKVYRDEAWWSALLAQALANRDQAVANREAVAAMLRVAPCPGEGGEGLSDHIEGWYATLGASGAFGVVEDTVVAAKASRAAAGKHGCAEAVVKLASEELEEHLPQGQGWDVTRALLGIAREDGGRIAGHLAEDVSGAMPRPPESSTKTVAET